MKQFYTLCFAILTTLLLVILPTPHRHSPSRANLKEVTLPTDTAQRQGSQEQLSTHHQERIARRAARQAEYERTIDSIVLAHSYRFIPQSMQVEPAGNMHYINNGAFELLVQPDFTDINLPYLRGLMPPYKMVVLNTVVNSVEGYTAVQTDNGWEVTFSSWLYEPNNYNFALSITSTTGNAQLTISNTFYSTVTYWGQVMQNY